MMKMLPIGMANYLTFLLSHPPSHGSSPPPTPPTQNLGEDLKMSENFNWGGDIILWGHLNFLGGVGVGGWGAMNSNDVMVIVLKDILLLG